MFLFYFKAPFELIVLVKFAIYVSKINSNLNQLIKFFFYLESFSCFVCFNC